MMRYSLYALEPILQQPVQKRHKKLTDFYNLSVILWVLEDAESICDLSVVIKSYVPPFGLT